MNLKTTYKADFELHPSELTSILQQVKVLSNNSVNSLEVIKQASLGLTSQILRIIPSYENKENEAPTSFIMKVSNTDKRSRMLNEHLFENEAKFYKYLSPTLKIKTPNYYFSKNNCRTEGLSFLLLEDLSMAETLENDCSYSNLSSSILEIAKLHAQFLKNYPRKYESWFLRNPYSVPNERSLHRILDKGIIIDDFRPILLQVIKKINEISEKLAHIPKTVIHGDFRSDNIMIQDIQGKQCISILDWQMVRLGHGLADVSHFMCSTFSAETRQLHEFDFLSEYHKVIQALTGYSPKVNDYLRDYRLSILLEIIRIFQGVRYILGINDSGSILEKGIYRLQLAMKRSLEAIKYHDSLLLLSK